MILYYLPAIPTLNANILKIPEIGANDLSKRFACHRAPASTPQRVKGRARFRSGKTVSAYYGKFAVVMRNVAVVSGFLH